VFVVYNIKTKDLYTSTFYTTVKIAFLFRKKAETGRKTKMVKTYKLSCKSCGKSYRTGLKQAERIKVILKTNPDYLKQYQCQSCSRGVTSTPKVTVKKTPESEVQEKLIERTTFEVSKDKVEVKKDVVEVKIKPRYDLSEYIPKSATKSYVHRQFGKRRKGSKLIKDIEVLQYHLDSKDPLMKNVLYIGETGTGKTALVEWFCWKNKLPYYRLVMNGGTTAEDIVGQMIPNPNGEGLVFVEQVLVKMMRQGGVFVFDEINAGQRDILHILNSLTDRERKIMVTQNDGEVVRAVDNFLVVACMNPPNEYEMNELPKSLKSRFTPYYFDFDLKIDEKVLGKGEDKLIEFTKKIRQARDNGIIETPLSTRDLIQFKTLRNTLGYEIAKQMLINKFQNGEKSEVKTEMEVCLEQSNILNKDGDTDE